MPRPSRFTADQKVDIVLRGLKGEDQIRELCQEVGIQPKTYYEWKKIFLETGRQGFVSKSPEKDEEKEAIQKENQRLKDLVADLSLENHILKKRLLKSYVEGKEYHKLPAEEKWDLLKFIEALPHRRKKNLDGTFNTTKGFEYLLSNNFSKNFFGGTDYGKEISTDCTGNKVL